MIDIIFDYDMMSIIETTTTEHDMSKIFVLNMYHADECATYTMCASFAKTKLIDRKNEIIRDLREQYDDDSFFEYISFEIDECDYK